MKKNIKLFDIPEDFYITDIEMVDTSEIDKEIRLMSIELEKLLEFEVSN